MEDRDFSTGEQCADVSPTVGDTQNFLYHKTLFLDIETTGLAVKEVPGKRPGTTKKQQLDYATEYNDFPYTVSMAWAIDDNPVKYYILNQEGRTIPPESIEIHGITDQMASETPFKFRDVMGLLILDTFDVEIVVGHGLYFDTSIIKANLLRDEPKLCNIIGEVLHKHKRIDTMKSTAKMCGKWPKLSELYMKIFKAEYIGHNAALDVEATRKCYKWLLSKGIVPTWEKLQEKKAESEVAA